MIPMMEFLSPRVFRSKEVGLNGPPAKLNCDDSTAEISDLRESRLACVQFIRGDRSLLQGAELVEGT